MELIGQSLELWRPPLAAALARRDAAPILACARRQLAAGAHALDLNLGAEPRPGLADDLIWAATTLRRSFSDVPPFLDCGDLEVLTNALAVAPPPVVANAVTLDPLGHSEATMRPLAAAADAGAGVVFSPRVLDGRTDAGTILDAVGEALRLADSVGLRGPLYLDCLAYPPASDPGRCIRSLAWLRALRADGSDRLVPLVAVGNVAHGAPRELRSALRCIYVALAVGAGARALILPVEDRALMRAIPVVSGERALATAAEAWLLAASEASRDAAVVPPPPDDAYRRAWELLATSQP